MSQLEAATIPRGSRLSPEILAFVTNILRDFVMVTSQAHMPNTETSGLSKEEKRSGLEDGVEDWKAGLLSVVDSGLEKLDPDMVEQIQCLKKGHTAPPKNKETTHQAGAHDLGMSRDEFGTPELPPKIECARSEPR